MIWQFFIKVPGSKFDLAVKRSRVTKFIFFIIMVVLVNSMLSTMLLVPEKIFKVFFFTVYGWLVVLGLTVL